MNKIFSILIISSCVLGHKLTAEAKQNLSKSNINKKIQDNTTDDRLNSIFNKIKDNYGIRVYYQNNKNFFPSYWQTKDINPKLNIIAKTELKRFPKLLEQELNKYSKSTLQKNLKSIHLAKKISFYKDNLIMGATNSGDGIFLTSNGIKNYYTDQYLIHIFHHEFSSILIRNNKFPQDEWQSWNPRGFIYSSDGNQANREKRNSLSGNEELYNDGLLSEYSLASFEEDLNVYSGMIFSEPDKFYKLKNKYPAIREKFNIWLRFYHSIDPKFTEEYVFKSVNKIAEK